MSEITYKLYVISLTCVSVFGLAGDACAISHIKIQKLFKRPHRKIEGFTISFIIYPVPCDVFTISRSSYVTCAPER